MIQFLHTTHTLLQLIQEVKQQLQITRAAKNLRMLHYQIIHMNPASTLIALRQGLERSSQLASWSEKSILYSQVRVINSVT